MNPILHNSSTLFLYYLIFIAMWFAVGFMTAMISGWWELAETFRSKRRWQGRLLRFHSAEMNGAPFGSYYNCVHFGVSKDGLFIALNFLFRGSHPSLMVPWEEITVLEGTSGVLLKKKQLLLGREQAVTLRLSAALAEELRRQAGTMWPREISPNS